MKCKACNKEIHYKRHCPYCGYYCYSCISGNMYNILKVGGNAEIIYEAIMDNKECQVIDKYGNEFTVNKKG